MKDFAWSKARRAKNALRERNTSGSIGQRLEQLDRLRERSDEIRRGTPRDAKVATGRAGSTQARRKK